MSLDCWEGTKRLTSNVFSHGPLPPSHNIRIGGHCVSHEAERPQQEPEDDAEKVHQRQAEEAHVHAISQTLSLEHQSVQHVARQPHSQ